jgi:integrase
MGKRGNGEGSITRRSDGRWMARYMVHTAAGPKRKYIYGKTRQEVAEELSKALSDRASGLVFDVGTLTLDRYLDRWLSHSVRGSVRQRTLERYEQIARVHIKPTLGRIKLKALTPTAFTRGSWTTDSHREPSSTSIRRSARPSKKPYKTV